MFCATPKYSTEPVTASEADQSVFEEEIMRDAHRTVPRGGFGGHDEVQMCGERGEGDNLKRGRHRINISSADVSC